MYFTLFFLQANTAFHLVYIAASTLIDIKGRVKSKTEDNNTDEGVQSVEMCPENLDRDLPRAAGSGLNSPQNPTESVQSSERCYFEPVLLFLLHLAAVIVSCMNFFVEQVSDIV